MAEAVVDEATVAQVRTYLEELGVADIGALPGPDVVVAAGNALLQTDIYLGPQTDSGQVARMRRDRNTETNSPPLPFLQRHTTAAYGVVVHRLIGHGVRDFRGSEVATAVREHHFAAPGSDGEEFERLLGGAFIACLGRHEEVLPTQQPPEKRWVPGKGVERSFGIEDTISVQLPDRPGDIAELSPAFSRVLGAVDAVTRGMWERLVVVTSSEFTATATKALAARVGATGQVAVRQGAGVETAYALGNKERGKFQMVGVDVSISEPDDAGRLVRASYRMLARGGLLVVRSESLIGEVPASTAQALRMGEELFGPSVTMGTTTVSKVGGAVISERRSALYVKGNRRV